MLSYRHHYHAGNFADVLKYFVLYEVLNYQNRKETPYLYLDSHAGAGLYLLDEKNREYEGGLGSLLKNYSSIKNAELKDFADFLRLNTPKNKVLGSAVIAAKLLRPSDTLRCFELHPSDYPLLVKNLSFRKKRTIIEQADGFKALSSLLPPPSKRAVVLIDPPYEVKSDYVKVVKNLELALKKFPQAVIMLWYPLLNSLESHNLPKNLEKLAQKLKLPFINPVLKLKNPPQRGMFGSGVFVINPPYVLNEQLEISNEQLRF